MTNSTKIILGISEERLAPYRQLGDTDSDALERYEHNLLLAEALHPSLHMLEVVLRNNLEAVLKKKYGENWYKKQKLHNLMVKDLHLSAEGRQLKRALGMFDGKDKKRSTSGRIVAELSFGFWTGLLGKDFEFALWRPHSEEIFPDATASERNIKDIRVDLKRIRLLRNRVAHHEPIWNDPHLLNKHAALTRLLAWLNAAAQTCLVRCDRFAEVHRRLGLSVKN